MVPSTGIVESFDRMANQMLGEMGINRMSSSPFSSELGNSQNSFCLITLNCLANFGSAFSKMDKMFE